jgi:enoyl-CoA hydratase/carnithine racemase
MECEIPTNIQKEIEELKYLVYKSQDYQEGLRAFLESRQPFFTAM